MHDILPVWYKMSDNVRCLYNLYVGRVTAKFRRQNSKINQELFHGFEGC